MEKFIKEVESKLREKQRYINRRENLPKDSTSYTSYTLLIDEINNWLDEQVDLDLPVYFNRLSYYKYLKHQKEITEIPVSKEDNIVIPPYNPGLHEKLYECMWEADKKYKLNADRIQNMSDVIAVFKLLDIEVDKIDLLKSGIEPDILERLFDYKGE